MGTPPLNLQAPLVTSRELLTQPLLPLVWDVEPLISRGDRVIMFGEFGSFKSWILLHLAWHLAAGVQWLDTFTIREQRRVLYVDEEMNERTLRRRGKRLADGAGISGEPPVAFLSRAGVRFDAYGAGRLLSYLQAQKFHTQIIIVEALRRVLMGNENEASDLAAFWRNLEPVSRLGITIIISHHMTKPPAQGKRAARYRASGSTDILAGSDASFAIERVSEDTSRITGIKARDDVELRPFLVQLGDGGDRQAPMWLRKARVEASRALTPEESRDVLLQPVI